MVQALKRTRLELSAFAEAHQKHVDPSSPPPMRMMAAKAMVPMGPDELVTVLYQLSYDPEAPIRDAAKASLADFPPEMVDAVIRAKLDPMVLDYLGHLLLKDDARLEVLVVNQAVHDQTIAYLSERVSERITEIIAGIHTRLLRHPVIIEGLYLNPASRMSTVEKILDLANRNGIELKGLPAVQKAMEHKDYHVASELDEDKFQALLEESAADPDREVEADDERIEALLAGEEDAATPEEEERLSRWQTIERMNPAQKIRLAVLGSKEDRAILLRDTRKIVHMAAVQSPKISPGEAAKLAGNRSLPDGVISYIAKKRDWVRFYPVVIALVNNPKTPMGDAIAFLKTLRPNDLRTLQRNKNVPSQLQRQARVFYQRKQGGR